MMTRVRQFVAPAYLLVCLLLGGSSQGIWGNALLQLLAIAIIAWAVIEPRDASLPRPVKQLLLIAVMAAALVLLQLVPLPVGLWTALPGRQIILSGFEILGLEPGPMPISLAPYDSLAALLMLLPPLGMLAATLILRGYSATWLAATLIAGTVAGVLLGILQVISPAPQESPWYLYRFSNFGVATGYFANSNHMACLLVITMPFVAAFGANLRERANDRRAKTAALAFASSLLAAIVIGLFLNRSLAGIGLGVPVLLASLAMLFGLPPRLRQGGLIAIGLAGLIGVAILTTSPVGARLDGLDAKTSVVSRQQIFANSLDLARDYGPLGSGLGTFEKAYPQTEDPATVDRFYVNHAHNDYLELVVEMGIPALLLIMLFLAWWGSAVWRMLRSPAADEFALAGAIAAAVVLLHSAVDYPLRTAAISVVFASCLALILQSRRGRRGENDLRTTRHLVIG